jgi:hypothetical protein
MKNCNICKIEKELSEFTIRKEGTYRNECKKCRILYLREYRKGIKNNPYKLEPKTTKICRVCNNEKSIDKFVKSKRICTICQKEYLKKRYLDKKESESKKSKIRYELNKKEIKKRNSEYSKNNRVKINQRSKKYKNEVLKDDPLWIIKNRISGGIRRILKSKGIIKKFSTNSQWYEIVGCTVSELRNYIESQFLDGMSWEERELWHVDHIIPISFGKNEKEIMMLSHYSNLRPMWSKDNIIKSNEIDESNELYIKILDLRDGHLLK